MTGGTADEARAIGQDLLDRTRDAYVTGDLKGFAACFLLPQAIDTFTGSRVLMDEGDLADMFHSVREFQSRMMITDMVRHVVAAGFADAETVHYSHETRLLSGDRMIRDPHAAFSIVRRVEGVWKVASSQYAITQLPALDDAIMGRPGALIATPSEQEARQ